MSMIVYKATSPSGKIYIGLTVRKLSDRQKCHKHNALKTTKRNKFYNAIRKYGYENIKWEIIYKTNDLNDLLQKEQEFIKLYDSQINGYNITSGGEGSSGRTPWNKGKKYSKDLCLKMQTDHRKNLGKPVILINLKTKEIKEFGSIAEVSEKFNLNYSMVKTAVKLNYCLKHYRIVDKKKFDPSDLFYFNGNKQPHSKKFNITDGSTIKYIISINELRRFLNISERAARNLYYKNKEINGWKLCL